MKTGTKIKGFMLAAIIVAGWLYLFDPTNDAPKNRNSDEAQVILKVWWQPVRRIEPVKIMYRLGGATQYNGELNESPWFETFFTPRGTKVTLIAIQSLNFDPGTLHCTVTAGGISTTDDAMLRDNDVNSCIVMGVA